ncbi:MAG: CoA transferase subunit A [Candidatus Freyarchaeota archaeon]
MTRKEVIMGVSEAASMIKDGMTVGVGGLLTANHPMAIIRQIIKNGVKNLTVVGSPAAGLEIDLMIGAGVAKKVATAYVGGESLAPIGPFFRKAVIDGTIQMWECDEAILCTALRAAAEGLPFLPWLGGVGTCLPDINPDLKYFQDPIKGQKLLAVPALELDVAILHASWSDPYGNIQYVGNTYADILMARASKKCIFQVEKVVPNEDIKRNPHLTKIYGVDAVVPTPYGSHPFSSDGFYDLDREHLKEYVEAAKAHTKGNPEPFNQYLKKYIFEPESHEEYLEVIGMKKLLSLYKW